MHSSLFCCRISLTETSKLSNMRTRDARPFASGCQVAGERSARCTTTLATLVQFLFEFHFVRFAICEKLRIEDDVRPSSKSDNALETGGANRNE